MMIMGTGTGRPSRIPRPDSFTIALLTVVLIATVLPCRGVYAVAFGHLTTAAIVLLFFMHGAKLSREAVLRGLGAWRLHLGVLACTFILFPVLGLGLLMLPDQIATPTMRMGFAYLCILPSTVQSSIAMTSIARGNVPAAVCSASLSNIIGVILTPLLAALMLPAVGAGKGGNVLDAIISIAVTLLLPFALGHFSRPVTGAFVDRNKAVLGKLDRGSILLVVYTAFSAAVVQGLWHSVSLGDIILIGVIATLLLIVVLVLTTLAARLLGMEHGEETVLVFCGSKKSLASGVPMAAAMFPAAAVGPMILPLMMFHQIQLIICAGLAQRYGDRFSAASELLVVN
jgi:sodium/bile acid cotransporter 7